MNEFNSLNILGEREVDFMPPHFSKTKLEIDSLSFYIDGFQDVRVWINTKLKGRYSIKKLPTIGNDSKMKSTPFIGFEDSKELTYFMLACPYIRR
jgi:hypothetical protein